STYLLMETSIRLGRQLEGPSDEEVAHPHPSTDRKCTLPEGRVVETNGSSRPRLGLRSAVVVVRSQQLRAAGELDASGRCGEGIRLGAVPLHRDLVSILQSGPGPSLSFKHLGTRGLEAPVSHLAARVSHGDVNNDMRLVPFDLSDLPGH